MLSSLLILPHGAQIVPLPDIPYDEAFRPLHEAMQRVGHDVAEQKTDLLIVLTPHGYTLADSFVVCLHERFQQVYYDLSESNVFGSIVSRLLVPGDADMATKLLQAMQQSGLPAEGLVHGSPSYPLTLAWGESVPLHYLVSGDRPRAVIVSLPRKRLSGLMEMQDDLARLGRVLLQVAQDNPGSVCIVISADLSHTHSAQGPYGFHASSSTFDTLVQAWAREPRRQTLNELVRLQPTAMACGMAGLTVAQAILDTASLRCDLVFYALPTYFGMMVARWR